MERFLRLLALLVTPAVAGCGGGGGGGGGPRVFTMELIESGDHTISGWVTLPDETPSGHLIQLRADADSTTTYSVIEGVGETDANGEFGFRLVEATDGSYRVRVAVDINDSGMVDSGDLVGWYGGTVAAPIQDSGLASDIVIAGASVENADFGVGPLP